MGDFNNTAFVSREDCLREYENHMDASRQGYYSSLESYASALSPIVGDSPFSKEGWKKIVQNDGLFNKALATTKRMFQSNEVLANRFERLMKNTRDTAISTDIGGYGMEGWGGGNAVYASSQGAFAIGATPFVIGGWLAAARSEEIFQHIDNKNSMRLEFEYNIDYLMVGDTKYYYPKAYRSGEIMGYNKLPKVDWVTPNTNGGAYTAPETWCGEEMFIILGSKDTAATTASASVKGNLLTVSGHNKRAFGIEPNCAFTAIKYAGKDNVEVTKRLRLNYDVATGATNERVFKSSITLTNVNGFTDPIVIDVYMKISLDTGDFVLMTNAPSADENVIIGLKFDAKVSNIANELTDIPTTGTEKFQFVRECEYRNYAKVSLNEYMADNFRIGSNNNISYAAYATDKMLQSTIFNRELEAEDYLINEVLDDDIDIDSFALTRKMGGFINNSLTFTIGKFTPGLHLQDYKDGLKNYLMKTLAVAETDLNLPASVKREWILLGYDALVTEFPDIKYENSVVDLNASPEGSAVNENYGFGVDTKCGFIDNLGRSVRIIGNTDVRWRDRGNKIFGAIKTYSMEYPFLVYYPHAIRMYTAIDADNTNRTAIYIGGREYRSSFAAGAVELTLNGVLDGNGLPTNNFDAQIADSKKGWEK